MMEKTDPNRLVLLALLIAILSVTDILLVLIVLSFIPLYLFVQFLAKHLRPDVLSIVDDPSSVFTVYPQDKCGANLNHFLWLDGTMTCDRFVELFDDRIMSARRSNGDLKFCRFRYLWTQFLGYSFWKEEQNYSTAKHVREYDLEGDLALPSPCYQEDVRRVMGYISGKPWSTDKSPWEVLLIQNYRNSEADQKPKTVIVFSHHHALIDGYGIVSLIRLLFECEYKLPTVNVPPTPLWYRFLAPLKMPFDLAQWLLDVLDGEMKWKVPDDMPKELEASMSSAIPVAEIKAIKNKLGVSYTAVIFAAVAGALERLAKEERMEKVPEFLGAHFPLPKRRHPGGTVNHAFLVGMRWDIRSMDRIDRTRAIQRRMNEMARSTVPEMGEWASWGIAIVPNFIRKLFMDHVGVAGSVGISCFPATEDTVSFDGHHITDVVSAPGGMGRLSVIVLTTGMNGKQRLGLTGNKHVFSARALQNLGRYVDNEIEALSKARVK